MFDRLEAEEEGALRREVEEVGIGVSEQAEDGKRNGRWLVGRGGVYERQAEVYHRMRC